MYLVCTLSVCCLYLCVLYPYNPVCTLCYLVRTLCVPFSYYVCISSYPICACVYPVRTLLRILLYRYGSEDSTGLDEVPLMMQDEGFDTDENDYLMRPRGIRGPKKKSLGYYLTDGWKLACAK